MGIKIFNGKELIMTTITGDIPKVYSADKKLWLDMSREEALEKGSEVLKLFNYADRNNDKNISQDELNRYNGPVIIENYETADKTRVVTQGRLDVRYASLQGVSNSSLDNEEEFYPGLDLNKVSKQGIDVFIALDTNKDKTLSKAEMETAAKIQDKINEAFEKLSNEIVQKVNGPASKGLQIGAGAAGTVGAIALGICAGIEDGVAFGLLGGGFGALAGAIVGGLIGAGIGIYNGCKNKAKYTPEVIQKTLEESLGNLKNHPYAKYLEKIIMKKVQDVLELATPIKIVSSGDKSESHISPYTPYIPYYFIYRNNQRMLR